MGIALSRPYSKPYQPTCLLDISPTRAIVFYEMKASLRRWPISRRSLAASSLMLTATFTSSAMTSIGVDFTHADGSHIHVADLLGSADGDVPEAVKGCFAFDEMVSYI
ncbi:hypothetical protein Salat_1086300 [Sesamum alatum]|uniref:Uncharacterized protein n=1 Tax=Sesamum alatum TaxID=300844 RepID=A0AAE1YN18_9LAMI|nr:hypothetical protein Salat_1086300 [Sesamum alatum]